MYEHQPEINQGLRKVADAIQLVTDDKSNVTQAFALFSDGVGALAPILKAVNSETEKNAKLKVVLKLLVAATDMALDDFIKDEPNTPPVAPTT